MKRKVWVGVIDYGGDGMFATVANTETLARQQVIREAKNHERMREDDADDLEAHIRAGRSEEAMELLAHLISENDIDMTVSVVEGTYHMKAR